MLEPEESAGCTRATMKAQGEPIRIDRLEEDSAPAVVSRPVMAS